MNEMRIMKSVRQVSFFCALIVRYEYRAIFFPISRHFFFNDSIVVIGRYFWCILNFEREDLELVWGIHISLDSSN